MSLKKITLKFYKVIFQLQDLIFDFELFLIFDFLNFSKIVVKSNSDEKMIFTENLFLQEKMSSQNLNDQIFQESKIRCHIVNILKDFKKAKINGIFYEYRVTKI